jgi:hypothetical protein
MKELRLHMLYRLPGLVNKSRVPAGAVHAKELFISDLV